ncbi:hypothetical protein TNIN_234761 [Trichonephila inaurata madagascariensis]|uniref:Uncharacterized protein n=1 Tax=Trichonephila inaurata madagascariensis TaxID=2747483 RepID=A0A8X6IA71_9ARAC|nr:hypothetical protein TNIN_234761 [Trichonephila inaurata madagascariensis]
MMLTREQFMYTKVKCRWLTDAKILVVRIGRNNLYLKYLSFGISKFLLNTFSSKSFSSFDSSGSEGIMVKSDWSLSAVDDDSEISSSSVSWKYYRVSSNVKHLFSPCENLSK